MYFFISHPAIFKQIVKKIKNNDVKRASISTGKSLLIMIIQITPENSKKKTNFR